MFEELRQRIGGFLESPSVEWGGAQLWGVALHPARGEVRLTCAGNRRTLTWETVRYLRGVGGVGLRWIRSPAPGAHGLSVWAGGASFDITLTRESLYG